MRAWLSILALALLFGAAFLWREGTRPEETAGMRGLETAGRMGCFACHGPGGAGGVPDPSAAARHIPGWEGPVVQQYVKSEDDIREWILHGAPRHGTARPDRSAGAVPMPAYEGFVTERELADLVAAFEAISGWAPKVPDDAYEGSRVARQFGCAGCHGPSGEGGVSNPGSFKGRIPPWTGREFAELVHDELELRAWILEGTIPRFQDNPAARHFLDRQRIRMPAYKNALSDEQLGKLIAYIRWLRGPKG